MGGLVAAVRTNLESGVCSPYSSAPMPTAVVVASNACANTTNPPRYPTLVLLLRRASRMRTLPASRTAPTIATVVQIIPCGPAERHVWTTTGATITLPTVANPLAPAELPMTPEQQPNSQPLRATDHRGPAWFRPEYSPILPSIKTPAPAAVTTQRTHESKNKPSSSSLSVVPNNGTLLFIGEFFILVFLQLKQQGDTASHSASQPTQKANGPFEMH
jgi:hypothetical protein